MPSCIRPRCAALGYVPLDGGEVAEVARPKQLVLFLEERVDLGLFFIVDGAVVIRPLSKVTSELNGCTARAHVIWNMPTYMRCSTQV